MKKSLSTEEMGDRDEKSIVKRHIFGCFNTYFSQNKKIMAAKVQWLLTLACRRKNFRHAG